MVRSLMLVFVLVCAWVLAGCGNDCGGGGFFGGASESAAPAPAPITATVRLDRGDTVIVEVSQTTSGSACYPGQTVTVRYLWDPVARRAVVTTAVPSTSVRTVTGAQLGGGTTTYENVIPGLTIRVSGGAYGGPLVVTFESGAQTSTLTCQGYGTPTCS